MIKNNEKSFSIIWKPIIISNKNFKKMENSMVL